MSTTIVVRGKATLVSPTHVKLAMVAFATNVSPRPTPEQLRREPFEEFGTPIPVNDPRQARAALEDLARNYEGGMLKENYRTISGANAFALWVKRIRKVAPQFAPLPARASCVTSLSKHMRACCELPALQAGETLSAEKAQAYLKNGIPVRIRYGFGDSEQILRVAFVKDGNIYLARTAGANRGYLSWNPVCVDNHPASPARAKLECRKDGSHIVMRCTDLIEDETAAFLSHDWEPTTPSKLHRSEWKKPGFMSQEHAMEAAQRLNAACPEYRWLAVPRSTYERAVETVSIFGGDVTPEFSAKWEPAPRRPHLCSYEQRANLAHQESFW